MFDKYPRVHPRVDPRVSIRRGQFHLVIGYARRR